jgi:hypothetical protein
MATSPRCANQAFNITNGDLIRWENVWPRFADYFEMPLGRRQHIQLSKMMQDKESIWAAIVARHGLMPIPYGEVVRWNYGDYVFSTGHDVISSTMKAREFGFGEFLDTEKMFLRQFDELRANKIIPPASRPG